METGDQLIQDIMLNKSSEVLPNQLVRELYRGYPVKKVRCFLLTQDEQLLKIGIWIASELGVKCSPLFEDVVKLLNHKLAYIRFYAIDCILVCSTINDGEAAAKVLFLLNDIDPSVRWKAIGFLMRAANDLLQGTLNYFEETKKETNHIQGIRLLLNEGKNDTQEIISFINSKEPVLRKYGVAAAAKIFHKTNIPLREALSSDDQDIKNFAEQEFHLSLRNLNEM